MFYDLKLSVLMCVFNEPIKWIDEAIKSILNQTFKEFELIIINDNPERDDFKIYFNELIKNDNRVRVHHNSENFGLTYSLNIGLGICKGRYMARMDADDISMPGRLAKQVAFMDNNPNVIVCGTDVKYFGRPSILKGKAIFRKDVDIRGQMLLDSGFVHPSVIIRKEILDKNMIRYDENFRTAQDYKLWLDLSPYGEFANLKEVLLHYRLSTKQISKVSTTNQTQGRQYVSERFREIGIKGCVFRLDTKTNKIELESLPPSIDDKTIKIINAYYQRSFHYNTFRLQSMVETVFSPYTKISLKERVLIIAMTIKKRLCHWKSS